MAAIQAPHAPPENIFFGVQAAFLYIRSRSTRHALNPTIRAAHPTTERKFIVRLPESQSGVSSPRRHEPRLLYAGASEPGRNDGRAYCINSLNQPPGAILTNAEAAKLILPSERPELDEFGIYSMTSVMLTTAQWIQFAACDAFAKARGST
jgi:hypothetical protein